MNKNVSQLSLDVAELLRKFDEAVCVVAWNGGVWDLETAICEDMIVDGSFTCSSWESTGNICNYILEDGDVLCNISEYYNDIGIDIDRMILHEPESFQMYVLYNAVSQIVLLDEALSKWTEDVYFNPDSFNFEDKVNELAIIMNSIADRIESGELNVSDYFK